MSLDHGTERSEAQTGAVGVDEGLRIWVSSVDRVIDRLYHMGWAMKGQDGAISDDHTGTCMDFVRSTLHTPPWCYQKSFQVLRTSDCSAGEDEETGTCRFNVYAMEQ